MYLWSQWSESNTRNLGPKPSDIPLADTEIILVVMSGFEPLTCSVWRRCTTAVLHHRNIGAPWQNRTAVTWLQNRCNTIILIGQMLPCDRGNYSTSVYFWFVYIAPVSPSHMPSTHSPSQGLSCCQRWLGRPMILLMPYSKGEPSYWSSVSFSRADHTSSD